MRKSHHSKHTAELVKATQQGQRKSKKTQEKQTQSQKTEPFSYTFTSNQVLQGNFRALLDAT